MRSSSSLLSSLVLFLVCSSAVPPVPSIDLEAENGRRSTKRPTRSRRLPRRWMSRRFNASENSTSGRNRTTTPGRSLSISGTRGLPH